MIDTLRADHLGLYGYARNTSPNLDAFAKDALVFDYAVTSAPWTPPSVASMFTGLYPLTHGVIPPNSREQAQENNTKLPETLVTLAEVFKGNGYKTFGFSPNPWISQEFGFDQGFDTFWHKSRADADEITSRGLEAIKESVKKREPFFAYLHYLDPHDPYKPPQKYQDLMASEPPIGGSYGEDEIRKLQLYDAEIRFTDDKVGEVLAYLKAEGIYDDVAIVVVADHGEQFKERGHQGHGFMLFDEEVHVPFMFKPAKSSGGKRSDITVSTVDVFPTVLEMASISFPPDKPGFSLLSEEKIGKRSGVYSEISRKINDQRAFVTPDGLKLIVEFGKDGSEKTLGVFNSRKDPFEVAPIEDAELVASLRQELNNARQLALDGKIEQSPESSGAQVKDSTLEQLKTLGYLQ